MSCFYSRLLLVFLLSKSSLILRIYVLFPEEVIILLPRLLANIEVFPMSIDLAIFKSLSMPKFESRSMLPFLLLSSLARTLSVCLLCDLWSFEFPDAPFRLIVDYITSDFLPCNFLSLLLNTINSRSLSVHPLLWVWFCLPAADGDLEVLSSCILILALPPRTSIWE